MLAAAIHRMVAYRAGEAGATHDAIAELHRITAAESRGITPVRTGDVSRFGSARKLTS